MILWNRCFDKSLKQFQKDMQNNIDYHQYKVMANKTHVCMTFKYTDIPFKNKLYQYIDNYIQTGNMNLFTTDYYLEKPQINPLLQKLFKHKEFEVTNIIDIIYGEHNTICTHSNCLGCIVPKGTYYLVFTVQLKIL